MIEHLEARRQILECLACMPEHHRDRILSELLFVQTAVACDDGSRENVVAQIIYVDETMRGAVNELVDIMRKHRVQLEYGREHDMALRRAVERCVSFGEWVYDWPLRSIEETWSEAREVPHVGLNGNSPVELGYAQGARKRSARRRGCK